jgi:flagellar motility protein MotE (MotC chaperone)
MSLEEIEKPYSKLQWLFYIIIIPLFFTMFLVGMIFFFLGINVVDPALAVGQKVPGLSAILPEPKEKIDSDQSVEVIEESLIDTEQRLSQSEEEINRLEREIALKAEEIEGLLNQIEQFQSNSEEKKLTEEERLTKLRELATIYGGMSTSKSAAVLENLTLREAALIMQQLNTTQQSAVMSKLEAPFAANLTVVMKEMDIAEDPEIAALQERINLLMDMLDEETESAQATVPLNNMANTFSQMPPAQAAAILVDMSQTKTEFQLGVKLLANMADANRSGIMSVMSTDIAKKYTNALTK